MNKLLFLLAFALSVSSTVFAKKVRIDGIWYNLLETTAEVIEHKDYAKYFGDINIPCTVSYDGKEYSVTSIGEYAFAYSNLTSITIPNNVTKIGSRAFSGCSGLTSMTIPNSVTTIGDGAFMFCGGLTSVTIPNSVTSIGNYAFNGCSGLTSVTIPNSVKSIGVNPFENCRSLTSITVDAGNAVYDSRKNSNAIIISSTNSLITGCNTTTIPNSVTSIGEFAFACSNLTSITIPNNVTKIGSRAFFGCIGLTSITIPKSVTSIGNEAFSECSGLTSVTIPNSVTSIGNKAFSECSGLTSVTIPNSVTSIGYGAFYGCTSLTSITVDAGNTVFDSRENCNAIIISSTNSLLMGCNTSTIPNSVTKIGNRAFSECSGLTSVTIPNSVTRIGNGAFYGCSALTSVTIPNSVTRIGNGAFVGCHISEIISKVEKPFDIEKNMFNDDTYSNATLYVPVGTVNKYKATEGWMKFQNIKEGLPSSVMGNGNKGK